jgi:RHS repeat-associated protein
MEARNINSDLINKYVYGYNKVHMKMFEERGHDSNKGDVYDYDEFQRLTNVKFNSPEPQVHETTQFDKSWSAQYDKVDNILSIVETENQTTNEITPTMDEDNAKLNQYTTFDQWGLTYDQNGNTTQKGTQDFTYDYRNQLVSTSDGTTSADYKYDALGRRMQKLVTSGAQTDTTKYYYSGNQVIEERDGSDTVLKQYIYGNGIDELLIIVNFDGATQTDYYVHTNSIGSVTAITDQGGNLVERVSYDTFGMPTFTDYQTDPENPTVVSNSLIGNDILFQGRRYDEEINLYYYRARYYDPIMGRFLQTDPAGYKDSMNLYQAFNMNGVNYLDPFGKWIGGIHAEITKDAVSGFRKKIYNIFSSPYHGRFFFGGLISGANWPDRPDGSLKALDVFDLDGFDVVLQDDPDKSSLTYRSHFGDLQHWHAMKYGNRTNEETKELMIHDIMCWLLRGRKLLFGRSRDFFGTKLFYDQIRYEVAGELIGMAMHIIEDSYCPSHAERDPETWEIIKFYDYTNQDKEEHEVLDKFSKLTEIYYDKAKSAVRRIYQIIFSDQKDENVESILRAILYNEIFVLKED